MGFWQRTKQFFTSPIGLIVLAVFLAAIAYLIWRNRQGASLPAANTTETGTGVNGGSYDQAPAGPTGPAGPVGPPGPPGPAGPGGKNTGGGSDKKLPHDHRPPPKKPPIKVIKKPPNTSVGHPSATSGGAPFHGGILPPSKPTPPSSSGKVPTGTTEKLPHPGYTGYAPPPEGPYSLNHPVAYTPPQGPPHQTTSDTPVTYPEGNHPF